jgi:hypothetical protein
MIERIVSLAAQYLSTVGALALTQAEQDLARWRRMLRARLAGAPVLATGLLWLNVAVLLWPMSTPYALAGAFAIAAAGIVAGLAMSARARRDAGSLTLLEPVDGPRFEPASRTMRGLLWLWRAIPRVPAGTALFGALGVLAVSSPRLRRLAAVMALLRNLGGHPRQAGSGPVPAYPSSPS